MSLAATTSAPARVPSSRECLSCGFDIIGLDPAGPCPECGMPLRETFKHPLLRELGAPRALRVAWGLKLTFLGYIGTVFFVVAAVTTLIFASLINSRSETVSWVLFWAALLAHVPGAVWLYLHAPATDRIRTLYIAGLGGFLLSAAVTMHWHHDLSRIVSFAIFPSLALTVIAQTEILRSCAVHLGRFSLARWISRWRRITVWWFAYINVPVYITAWFMLSAIVPDTEPGWLTIGLHWYIPISYLGHLVWYACAGGTAFRLWRGARREALAAGCTGSQLSVFDDPLP